MYNIMTTPKYILYSKAFENLNITIINFIGQFFSILLW